MPSGFEPVWEFQHSVDCSASRQFVWNYWTDISNWNDPPATFHLDGPFRVGARLTTNLPGQTLQSVVRDIDVEREATIEMQLTDATFLFHWMFEKLAENETRIHQRLVLAGGSAKSLVAQASILERTAPEGMKRLVAAIERAQVLNNGILIIKLRA